MKIKLATKVEVKTSPGKGMGVFAISKIVAGELIEECHLIFLEMDLNQPSSFLEHYRFLYPLYAPSPSEAIPIACCNGD